MMTETDAHDRDHGFGCLACTVSALAIGACLLPGAGEMGGVSAAALPLGAFALVAMLLAVFGVLGPGRLLVRWIGTLVLGGVLLFVFCGVLAATFGSWDGSAVPIALLVLPSVLLFVQLPVLVFHLLTGVRLLPEGTVPRETSAARGQFTIAQMMQATAIVAFVLACVRSGMSLSGAPAGLGDWFSILLPLGALLGVSCLLFLPALTAGLSDRPMRECSVWLGVYWFVLTVLLGMWADVDNSIEAADFVIGFSMTLASILFGGFFIVRVLRANGFYVYRPGSPGSRPSPSPNGESQCASTTPAANEQDSE